MHMYPTPITHMVWLTVSMQYDGALQSRGKVCYRNNNERPYPIPSHGWMMLETALTNFRRFLKFEYD